MMEEELAKFTNKIDFSNIPKEPEEEVEEENLLNNYETFKCKDLKTISKSTPGIV
jgi:hypothetical protein